MTTIADPPPEFELPPAVAERHLRLLEDAMNAGARRPPLRRWQAIAATAVVFVALAAFATAATTMLFDRDVTRADIDARLTFTTQTSRECAAPGECAPPRAERIGVIRIFPADGVTFVDPEGYLATIVPATGIFGFESASELGRALARSRSERDGGERAVISLPDGGTRTFSWVRGAGTLTVTDRRPDGTATSTELRSGDVVPLVPGSLDDEPLTPDKAVTLDLAGGDFPVWVYPQRNEAYVGDPPWREDGRPVAVPAGLAAKYGIQAEAGELTVPVDATGGVWSFPVDGGKTRTVSWRAGGTAVTVVDRDANGQVLGQETVSVGRRVNAG